MDNKNKSGTNQQISDSSSSVEMSSGAPLAEDSPTLSQLLLQNSKTPQSTFMYPTSGKTSPPNLNQTPVCASKNPNAYLRTPNTPLTAPLKSRHIYGSGTKSLGMRRRLRSMETATSSTSSFQGLKRTPNRLVTPSKRPRNDSICSSPVFVEKTAQNTEEEPLVCRLAPGTSCALPKTTITPTSSTALPKIGLNILGRHKSLPKSSPLTPRSNGLPQNGLRNQKRKCSSFVSPLIRRSGDIEDGDCQPPNENNPPLIGFQTAGNKNISISHKAMKNAEKLFSRLNKELETISCDSNDQSELLNVKDPKDQVRRNDNVNIKERESADRTKNEFAKTVTEQRSSEKKNSSEVPAATSLSAKYAMHSKNGSQTSPSKPCQTVSRDSFEQSKSIKHCNISKEVEKSNILEDLNVDNMHGHTVKGNSNGHPSKNCSLDEEILSSFESSENTSETFPTCPSPILVTKHSSRKQQTKQKVDITCDSSCESPNKNSPPPLNQSSMLSDDFELEMLAIDLTERFDEVCEDNVGDNDPAKTDDRDKNKFASDARSQISGDSRNEKNENSPIPARESNPKVSATRSQPVSSSPQTPLRFEEPSQRPMPSTFPRANQMQAGDVIKTPVLNDDIAEEQQQVKVNEDQLDDAEMSVDDEMLLKVSADLEKEWIQLQDKRMASEQQKTDSDMYCQEVAFITASQKPIKISDSAMKRAEELINKTNNDHQCREGQTLLNCDAESPTGNRTTLPSKKLNSEYRKSENGFRCDSVHNSMTLIDKCSEEFTRQTPPGYMGFQTASHKPVVISEAALAKANKFFEEEEKLHETKISGTTEGDQGPSMPSFAGNKNTSQSTEKLANLFKSGTSTIGKKRNREYKAPRKITAGETEQKLNSAECAMKATDVSTKTTDVSKTCSDDMLEQNSSSPAVLPTVEHSKILCKKLLGARNHTESQILVSDESLVKAAELFDDLFN